MFQLFTDTDCDMTPELCAEFGYKLISMPYAVDGKEVYPYEDFKTFDEHTFYEMLRGGVLPTTSAISTQNYINYFEPTFAEGKDILYVHFSAAMTNTFDFMHQALETLFKKYPERKFYEVDAKGITIAGLNVALSVGDLAKEGKTPEEIVEWAKTEVDKHAIFFTADDLKFFHHSGRVSGLSATMGTLLGIKPLMHMSSEGKMVSIGKEKGRRKAFQYMVNKMEELGEDVKNHRIIIGHSDNLDMAEELAEMIRAKFGEDTKITYAVVNPTAGSHCGPDGVGVAFYAIHR